MLEAWIVASPRRTRIFGWLAVAIGLLGGAHCHRKLAAYPASPPDMSLARALEVIAPGPDAEGEVWARFVDLPLERARTFPFDDGRTHAAVDTPAGVVFVEWSDEGITPAPGPLVGVLCAPVARYERRLRGAVPDLAPADRRAWLLMTWGGPSNVRTGRLVMAAFVAGGLLFLWRARWAERRARAALRGELPPQKVMRWQVRMSGLFFMALGAGALLALARGRNEIGLLHSVTGLMVVLVGLAFGLASLVAPGLIERTFQDAEDEDLRQAMEEVRQQNERAP